MHQRALDIRTLFAVLTLGIAAAEGGCYGTPRSDLPDAGGAGAGGIGGSNGGNPGDAGDASSETDATACPAICPGPTTGPTTGFGACVNDECRISCNAMSPTLCAASKACVDVMSDSKNCGTCGHDCLGGSCAAGRCQPVMIAQYFGHPMIIYVGAQVAYATTDLGYVGRANKDGSDLKPLAMPGFASSVFIGTLLAEDADRVFLVRFAPVLQLSYCLASGCDATATPIGGQYAQYFAVDQANHKIVWVDYSPSRLVSASTVGTISGVDVPGGTLAAGSTGARLFYSQGGIYFVDGSSVSRIPVAGGSIATVTGGTAPLAILGANSTALFIYDGSVIGSVPLPSGDGARPKPLIAATVNLNLHGHFAADDTSMYWASNGQANTCQISNCSGTQKALPKRALDGIEDVDIDGTAVYLLADSSDAANPAVSTVWKLAK